MYRRERGEKEATLGVLGIAGDEDERREVGTKRRNLGYLYTTMIATIAQEMSVGVE